MRVLKPSGKRFVTAAGKRLLGGVATCHCGCGSGTPCTCASPVPSTATGCPDCKPPLVGDIASCTPSQVRVTLAGVSTFCYTDGTRSAKASSATISGSFLLSYVAATCSWVYRESPAATYTPVDYGQIGTPDTTCSGTIQFTFTPTFTISVFVSPGSLRVVASVRGNISMNQFDGTISLTNYCAGTYTVSNNNGPTGGSGGTATVEFCP